MKVLIMASGGGTNALKIKQKFDEIYKDKVEFTLGHNTRNPKVIEKFQKYPEVPVIHLPSPGDDFSRLREFIGDNNFDQVVLAGYTRILPTEIINLITGKCINIHPAMLPLHQGCIGYTNTVKANDLYAGCTVHDVTEIVDDGEYIAQAGFKIPSVILENPDFDARLNAVTNIGLHLEWEVFYRVLAGRLFGEYERPGQPPFYTVIQNDFRKSLAMDGLCDIPEQDFIFPRDERWDEIIRTKAQKVA
jgi:folate-dependent phosphoribosylglycinamide formyltransferase PurN